MYAIFSCLASSNPGLLELNNQRKYGQYHRAHRFHVLVLANLDRFSGYFDDLSPLLLSRANPGSSPSWVSLIGYLQWNLDLHRSWWKKQRKIKYSSSYISHVWTFVSIWLRPSSIYLHLHIHIFHLHFLLVFCRQMETNVHMWPMEGGKPILWVKYPKL